ncbi:hypothetical protein GE21DRAFT_2522 [Neurospora crassa]|uniref:Uncharacterized protein n=1 Tax=Neurospora crassa (strain ATCC 24698 / 74-OR23-1A / CBS 708.71 / DSM 1257 / FGSC 987) TaxID=367110 RepID=Q7SE25_NEUCR|nr:hypothetical protein NCU02769 [Neurospora crassa OR74A]EAA35028.1 hypothetical protein NCU02769 [Neurospora crassa OR74A]KHE87283.1 hypothetical protein GE21DRAFT_2522 [Neurospora crassa]|eukprot:XP_964264.1 hypothetical protein NCU02769 [Neurospora crassa OR74A]
MGPSSSSVDPREAYKKKSAKRTGTSQFLMQIHPGDEELLPPNSQQSLLGVGRHPEIVTNYASIIERESPYFPISSGSVSDQGSSSRVVVVAAAPTIDRDASPPPKAQPEQARKPQRDK